MLKGALVAAAILMPMMSTAAVAGPNVPAGSVKFFVDSPRVGSTTIPSATDLIVSPFNGASRAGSRVSPRRLHPRRVN
jgi:hypothetical protein